MAHSSTAAVSSTPGTTTGEINYFFQDENGKIHKVLKQVEIKQEPLDGSSQQATVYATTVAGSMGTFTQMNSSQPQFVRLQNSYNIQPTENTATYTVITPQSSSGSNSHNNSSSTTNSSNMQRQQQSSNTTTTNIPTLKYEPMEEFTTHTTVVKEEERYKYKPQILSNNAKTANKSKIATPTSHQQQNASAVQRKRKPEKAGKGLRHFSLKVCEKVKEKGTTTYNEVADELVAEEIQNNSFDKNCDQKNIRRRVYDALNVLMALQIISKDKKEIRWIGLPSSAVEQECSQLEKENEERRERIKQKHQQLRELLLQQVSFKSLIERNKEAERQGIIPTSNSSIQLPFIIVNTHKSTKINCSVTNDKSEYIFKFDDKFEMHDDAEVLKRMGLLFGLDKGQCSYEDIERAKALVPPNFEKYIEAYGNGRANDEVIYESEDDDMPSYDFIELAQDNSQHGFSTTNPAHQQHQLQQQQQHHHHQQHQHLQQQQLHHTTTLTSIGGGGNGSGGGGGGISGVGITSSSSSCSGIGLLLKTSDLDDDDEYVEHSDID